MPHKISALSQVIVEADGDSRYYNISSSDRTVVEHVHREISLATNSYVLIELPLVGAATGQQIIQIESDYAIYVSHFTSAASVATGEGWPIGASGQMQILTEGVSNIWLINASTTNTASVQFTAASVES